MSTQQNKIRVIIEKIWSKVKEPKAMSGDDIVNAIDDVYEAGEKNLVVQYWDMATNSGGRSSYANMFYEAKLRKEFFQVPITVKVKGSAANMFYFAQSGDVIDFVELERDYGFSFDFSEATTLGSAFQLASISKFGTIDARKVTSMYYAFGGNDTNRILEYIDRLICSEVTTNWNNAFSRRWNLWHVGFEGIIATSINISWSPLDKESLTKLLGCLSGSASGQSCSVNKDAVNKAFETSEGANDGSTSSEWLGLVGAKSNWTISLMEV